VLTRWPTSSGTCRLDRPPFPAHGITTLVPPRAVLCLVAEGAIALDDPVNGTCARCGWPMTPSPCGAALNTGGVDSPFVGVGWTRWRTVADVLGPVVGCSGPRGRVRLQATAATRCSGSYRRPHRNLVRTGGDPARPRTLGMADSWYPTRPRSRRTRRAVTGSSGTAHSCRAAADVRAPERGRAVVDGPDLVRFGPAGGRCCR